MPGHLHLASADQVSARSDAPIKIVLADDHAGMRRSLRLLLEGEPGLEVVAEAADVTATDDRVRALQPRVLVLDFRMRSDSGLELVRTLRADAPETEIVVVSMDSIAAFAHRAIRAGAIGFVLKDRADSDLPPAVRAAARGEEFISPTVTDGVTAIRAALGDGLSARETEVLRLVSMGHTSQEIGRKLGISRRTVETHKARIYEKLGLHTRAELVAYALRRHLMRV